MAAMALAKVKCDTELFQFMRDTHHGPLFGEGYQPVLLGRAVRRGRGPSAGGEDHSPFVDFDLLKLHPQMVNHGMGYYERWFRNGYNLRWGHDSGSMEQIDKYRAQELAYGHAGFIGEAETDNIHWVAREHHLVHPVQRLYGTASRWKSLRSGRPNGQAGVALRPANVAAADPLRQRTDGSGSTGVRALAGRRPPCRNGVSWPRARNRGLHGSARRQMADYAECPEYLFADARTYFQAAYVRLKKEIEPRLNRGSTWVGIASG